MKRKYLNGLLALSAITILLVGCGEVPQTEIDQANAAINEAKASGSEVYAVQEYLVLEDSMRSTMESIEEQKTKLFGKYTDLKNQLVGITAMATDVKLKTETRKEELKQQIQSDLADVKELIAANKQLISEAPTGKEGTTALLAISGELNAIEATIIKTSQLIEKNDFLTSQNQINAAKEKALAINTELQEVINKYKATTKTKKG